MWEIRQNGDRWELVNASGEVLGSFSGYAAALSELAQILAASERLQVESDEGLLPERWVSPITALSEPTGDGRDFSEVSWSWRDPGESLLPLMLHTETDMGHFGAELAGFIEEISLTADGTVQSRGRFYDTEEGRQARDLLLGGRRFGVSVDPGGGTEVEFRCVEEDEDGFCISEELIFTAYEIIGLTMTPFPGFARAHIELASDGKGEEDEEEPEPEEEEEEEVEAAAAALSADEEEPCEGCAREAQLAELASLRTIAAAGAPVAPPAEWFADPALERLTPLTITDDGRVLGHLAPWDQCHTSYQNDCILTPRSQASYAYFRLGAVRCADGSEVATGRITLGGGHAEPRLSYRGAIEHYDDAGSAVADVAAGEDEHGIWLAGALRPGVTEEQVRALRASSLSGDWRPIGAGLELVAALAVNSPGFPIARVASGRVASLVAAGARVMARLAEDPSDERIARLEAQLSELRSIATAPARERLRSAARARARERLLSAR